MSSFHINKLCAPIVVLCSMLVALLSHNPLFAQPAKKSFRHIQSRSSEQPVKPFEEQFPALHRLDNFQRYTTADGLSSNLCRKLLVDSKGFLWVGTLDGLNRFDGNKFVVFRSNPHDSNSLSGNVINSLDEDRNGILWIGTVGAGLTAYDRNANRFYRYLHSEKDSTTLAHNTVRRVFQDRLETIWVATDGGLNRLLKNTRAVGTDELGTGAFVRYRHNPLDSNTIAANGAHSFAEDSVGALLIAFFSGGVDRFDAQRESFIHYKADPRFPREAHKTPMNGLYQGRSGTLYGSTKEGLYRYEPVSRNLRFFKLGSDLDVWAFCEDNQKTVWVSLWVSGLYELTAGQTEFVRHTYYASNPMSSPESVWDIAQDVSGNLWIAGRGLSRLSLRARQFKSYTPKNDRGLFNEQTQTLAASENSLWIGGGTTLLRYDHSPSPRSWQMGPSLKSPDDFFQIQECDNGKVWIGTTGSGLCELDMNTNKFSFFADYRGLNSIVTFSHDKDGLLWIGTNFSGLHKFDPRTRKLVQAYVHDPADPSSLSENGVFSLRAGKDGTLWAGTFSNGLNRFDVNTGKFVNWQHDPNDSTSISSNWVMKIFEDRDESIWVTTSQGVNRLDRRTGKFTRFYRGDGTTPEASLGIVQDNNGDMWIGFFDSGLAKLDPKTGQFTTYTIEDGLPTNEFNAFALPYVLPNGEVATPNAAAITVFHPDSLRTSTFIPNIIITSFSVLDKSISLSEDSVSYKPITMPYDSNFFSFEFAALDLTVPERNQHAYKLEGYDENWNYVGNKREAHYTKVPPGKYVFRVKGTNSDGVWSTKEASIKIVITPPWWQTAWAYGSYGVLIVAGLYSFRRYEIKRERMKQEAQLERLKSEKRLQQEFSRQLIGTQEAERKRVASELHDSLGQQLLILNNDLQLYKQRTERKDEDFDHAVASVKEAIMEVREIATNLHPHHLEKLGLHAAVEAMIEHISRSTTVKFETTIEDVDDKLSMDAKINLYRVLQEAIANIVRHSGATLARTAIHYADNSVRTIIEDNGKGFAPGSSQDGRAGFGLKSMRERVNMIGGTLTLNSSPGTGTRIHIFIPIHN